MVKSQTDEALVAALKASAHPLRDEDDCGPLLDWIGDEMRVVLLGEATHGTHEFYRFRSQVTQRLIEERGFNIVAVEGDWPDAYRVNRYVRCLGKDQTAAEALADFRSRFPTWMWRNADALDLVGWLRGHNEKQGDQRSRAGFYGLDLYSLHSSVQAVIEYLKKVDPEAAELATKRYGCFERFDNDPQMYGLMTSIPGVKECEAEVVRQLQELRAKAKEYIERDGVAGGDEYLFAEINALVVRDAEQYYRNMYRDVDGASTWNLRDRHMFDTLKRLLEHVAGRPGGDAKAVVWAHNSHVGDARATSMGEQGELNIGQLAREHFGDKCFNLGFSTFTGTVTAAQDWDSPAERVKVRPALAGSIEDVCHRTNIPRFLVNLKGLDAAKVDEKSAEALKKSARPERAIGVVYRPDTERQSHYFNARVGEQFDAMCHVDETRAVEPLERNPEWSKTASEDLPETYPMGV